MCIMLLICSQLAFCNDITRVYNISPPRYDSNVAQKRILESGDADMYYDYTFNAGSEKFIYHLFMAHQYNVYEAYNEILFLLSGRGFPRGFEYLSTFNVDSTTVKLINYYKTKCIDVKRNNYKRYHNETYIFNHARYKLVDGKVSENTDNVASYTFSMQHKKNILPKYFSIDSIFSKSMKIDNLNSEDSTIIRDYDKLISDESCIDLLLLSMQIANIYNHANACYYVYRAITKFYMEHNKDIDKSLYSLSMGYLNQAALLGSAISQEELGELSSGGSSITLSNTCLSYGYPIDFSEADYTDGIRAIKSEGKWGYINSKGDMITSFKYDKAREFYKGLALVKNEDNWMFIDTIGRILIPVKVDYPRVYEGEKIIWSRSILPKGFYDYSKYDEVYNYRSIYPYVIARRDSAWYFVDYNGEELKGVEFETQFEYNNLQDTLFNDYYYKWVIYDTTEIVKAPIMPMDLEDMEDVIRTRADFVLPTFDDEKEYSEGLKAVKYKGWWGFIDKVGKVIIPFMYESVSSFSDGLAAVCLNDRWGYIDKDGKTIINMCYDFSLDSDFLDGLVAVRQGDKYGYIDKKGNEIIPFIYDYASEFSCGLAAVCKESKWGYIDVLGAEIIPLQYNDVMAFSEGLAAVKKDRLWAYINTNGEYITHYLYTYPGKFSEGLCAVNNGDSCGYIDTVGVTVVPFKYYAAGDFYRGVAPVYIARHQSGIFINNKGETVVSVENIILYNFHKGIASNTRNVSEEECGAYYFYEPSFRVYMNYLGEVYESKQECIDNTYYLFEQEYIEIELAKWRHTMSLVDSDIEEEQTNTLSEEEKITELKMEAEQKFIKAARINKL